MENYEKECVFLQKFEHKTFLLSVKLKKNDIEDFYRKNSLIKKNRSHRLLKKNFTRMRPDILHARIVFMEKMVNFASAEQKKELELAKSIKYKRDQRLKSYQEESDLLVIEHLLNSYDKKRGLAEN